MASAIPYPAPEGFMWQAHRLTEDQDGWRRIGWAAKNCRAGAGPYKKACGRPADLELSRSVPVGRNWWAYCIEHAYGKWLEDGEIWAWRLRAVDPTST